MRAWIYMQSYILYLNALHLLYITLLQGIMLHDIILFPAYMISILWCAVLFLLCAGLLNKLQSPAIQRSERISRTVNAINTLHKFMGITRKKAKQLFSRRSKESKLCTWLFACIMYFDVWCFTRAWLQEHLLVRKGNAVCSVRVLL